MDKFKIVLNREGVRALLKSEEMMACIQELADDITNRLGDGYITSAYTGRNRVNVSVGTNTKEAYQDNLENNTILKAVK